MAAPMKCMRYGFSKVIFALNSRNALIASSKLTVYPRTASALKCTASATQQSNNRLYSSDAGADSSDDEKKVRKKLDLAKPGKAKGSKPKTKTEGSDYKSQLLKATAVVSEAIGGDKEKTQTELLAALRTSATPQKDGEASGLTDDQAQETLKNLFSGMKVDADKKGQVQRQRRPTDGKAARGPRRAVPDVELYSGSALGIFKQASAPQDYQPNFYDVLEAEETRKKTKFPHANGFEEMADWTKEGKLWKFPIDNEQGLEEAQVGFHEHVFLEHLIEEGFPSKGPIRHFMELVVVGLSKNPHLTVQEKHAHVDWFRNYFKDKIEIVEALMTDSKETGSEKGVLV